MRTCTHAKSRLKAQAAHNACTDIATCSGAVREAAEHARQQEQLRLAAEREAEERRQEVEMLKKQLAAMDDKGEGGLAPEGANLCIPLEQHDCPV